jgi:1-phosphatidylinositol-4-phosphate 5-kinase
MLSSGGCRADHCVFVLRPWILIYSFVIVVLLVSVCVLMLAWHRLYLRGVPKTYNIRLRVLNYVSL